MDKNFFKFDIDDQLFDESNIKEQKTQNFHNTTTKTTSNDIFVCLKPQQKQLHHTSGFIVNEGLKNQKIIKSNISDVNDYVNFDFKFKKRQTLKSETETAELSQKMVEAIEEIKTDEEVEKIINKAHIGIIFY